MQVSKAAVGHSSSGSYKWMPGKGHTRPHYPDHRFEICRPAAGYLILPKEWTNLPVPRAVRRSAHTDQCYLQQPRCSTWRGKTCRQNSRCLWHTCQDSMACNQKSLLLRQLLSICQVYRECIHHEWCWTCLVDTLLRVCMVRHRLIC